MNVVFEQLEPWMERFENLLGCAGKRLESRVASPWQRVPHAQLRLVLQSDAAMEALLPGVPGCISLGDDDCLPFQVRRSGLILLPPALMRQPGAAALAARWGTEALHLLRNDETGTRGLASLLRHGAGLLGLAAPDARSMMIELLPAPVMAELESLNTGAPTDMLLAWMAGLLEGVATEGQTLPVECLGELELPMEALLISGGDSRLVPDPVSRLNRYGVCPRPRPEAVHFSSSTASAVSDHGFLYADLIRREWLLRMLRGGAPREIRRAAVDAIMALILELLQLQADEADGVITPSGTDAELVTVMLALAGAEGRPVTNVLVSPEESGKGVKLAGAGRYFDALAATKASIRKEQAAFPGADLQVVEVAIRDGDCHVRSAAEINKEWTKVAEEALARGHHVVAHVLLGSKTGLFAPDFFVVDRLRASAPDRVDVVVDACQMRSDWRELGDLVRMGWIVQVSGSKFLTGPPFSGALLLPPSMRSRATKAGRLLSTAPGVSLSGDWPLDWEKQMGETAEVGSFGSIIRWLPALMEGKLYSELDEDTKRKAFERFRGALIEAFSRSRHLEPIADEVTGDEASDIQRMSIMAFQVLGRRRDGSLIALTESECQWLFARLNGDMTGLGLAENAVEKALAALPCHIGQPVVLHGDTTQMAFLRLVLGARFFNFVGHAEPEMAEAALESEIADAKRVLAKIEWIAGRWWQFETLMERQEA